MLNEKELNQLEILFQPELSLGSRENSPISEEYGGAFKAASEWAELLQQFHTSVREKLKEIQFQLLQLGQELDYLTAQIDVNKIQRELTINGSTSSAAHSDQDTIPGHQIDNSENGPEAEGSQTSFEAETELGSNNATSDIHVDELDNGLEKTPALSVNTVEAISTRLNIEEARAKRFLESMRRIWNQPAVPKSCDVWAEKFLENHPEI